MPSYIRNLIAQGEHQQLDFKFGITDSRKIARSMAAFSNSDGGTLLIGVKDNGAIAGVRSEEEYYMIEAAANMYCKPEITFEAKTYNEEGKTVLEVVIPKDDSCIHYAADEKGRWLAYIRVKDQNLLVNNIWIRVWKRKKAPRGTFIHYTAKEEWLLKHLLHTDHITLSAFCKLASLPRKKAENILVNLISLELVRMTFADKGVLYSINPDAAEEENGKLKIKKVK